MMHYKKGENVEKETTREELLQLFQDCLPKDQGKDFLWMHVKGGTKVENVITYAKNALEKGEHRSLVWSGHGGGVVKTVSCAEIIKRKFPLYQLTRMNFATVEEHWLPQMVGLEEIVAKRQLPSLHIYMSLDPIDDSIEGVQKPNEKKSSYWVETYEKKGSSSGSNRYDKQIERFKQRGVGGGGGENHDNRNNPQKFKQNRKKPFHQQGDTADQGDGSLEQTQENKAKKFHKRQHWEQKQGSQTFDLGDDGPSTSQQALGQQEQANIQHSGAGNRRPSNKFKKFKPKFRPNNSEGGERKPENMEINSTEKPMET